MCVAVCVAVYVAVCADMRPTSVSLCLALPSIIPWHKMPCELSSTSTQKTMSYRTTTVGLFWSTIRAVIQGGVRVIRGDTGCCPCHQHQLHLQKRTLYTGSFRDIETGRKTPQSRIWPVSCSLCLFWLECRSLLLRKKLAGSKTRFVCPRMTM